MTQVKILSMCMIHAFSDPVHTSQSPSLRTCHTSFEDSLCVCCKDKATDFPTQHSVTLLYTQPQGVRGSDASFGRSIVSGALEPVLCLVACDGLVLSSSHSSSKRLGHSFSNFNPLKTTSAFLSHVSIQYSQICHSRNLLI